MGVSRVIGSIGGGLAFCVHHDVRGVQVDFGVR